MRHRPVAGLLAAAAILAVPLQPALAAESTLKVVTMLAKKTPIGQSFDGTLHTQVGAFALFGSLTLGAMLWAEPPSSRGD